MNTDMLTYDLHDDGTPTPGWRRVRGATIAQFQADLIAAGTEAHRSLPASSARRAEIATWLSKVSGRAGVVPAGRYPMEPGRVVVVEPATTTNLVEARHRSDLASAINRAARSSTAPTTKRPSRSEVAAAIAKARKALTS